MATYGLFQHAFLLYDTHGLPLASIMEVAESQGYIVSLLDFIMDAVAAGWPVHKATAVVREACLERYGAVPKGVF